MKYGLLRNGASLSKDGFDSERQAQEHTIIIQKGNA
jgi:hypothetical protein